MKVAFVTPRYGTEVLGGAEHAARRLAEELATYPDVTVEAYSSCARDMSWESVYPEGTTTLNGVTVHRFATPSRSADFDARSHDLFARRAKATLEDEAAWFVAQGPTSDAWCDAVAACDADVVVFYPYLYYPTVAGLPRVHERAVLHPAAHDEAPLTLATFKSVFEAAQGLVFQTESERTLVESRFDVAHHQQILMGLGVDVGDGDPQVARSAVGIGDTPYVLYLGRVDDGKGTGVLAEMFARYCDEHPECEHRLVVAGPVVHALPSDARIIVTGPVDEATKWGLLRGATALINPSPLEAFSIVLLEAWSAGTPVMVNAQCGPTREHVTRSGGGFAYRNRTEFARALDVLVDDDAQRAALAKAGAEYVEEWFTWPSLRARYRNFLERVIAHRP